jgi:hypothetical protein
MSKTAYPTWSDLWIVTNNVAASQATATALANKIISDINAGTQLPDFRPFSSSVTLCVPSHYFNGTYTNGVTNNGLSGTAENGDEVKGCVETSGNVVNCRK